MTSIKEIKFNISIPLSGLRKGNEFTVHVKDDASFLEALAIVDKQDKAHPEDSIFPIYEDYIYSYLQLFWDPRDNVLYEDCGISAYAPNEEGLLREFQPVAENPDYVIADGTYVYLEPDAGC
ncbi:MAG: hypothetical protein R6U96_02225 [Promethearchaeia archaeon]